MKLNKFIKTIKNDKTSDSKGQLVSISATTHQKMKQTSFFYNVPLNKLASAVLNQWLEENNTTILEDRITSLKSEVEE
tara:strand:- start:41 stop:274 length:234 start_codon:yes stop_codon:yes gene_type:complete